MGKPIITQRRGKGSTSFRAPSFKFKGAAKVPGAQELEGTVVDIIKCPAHTAPLVRVAYDSGDFGLQIAPEGVSVGDSLKIGSAEATKGNTLPLKDIPEGTLVYNIENQPGDGGKFVRSSGTFARVSIRTPKGITFNITFKKTKDFT